MNAEWMIALDGWETTCPDIHRRILTMGEARAVLLVEVFPSAGFRCIDPKRIRKVMVTARQELDEKLWLHLSLSRFDQAMPQYAELKWVHDTFLGPERISYQIFAPAKEHYSLHDTCLHLWCPLEHRPTPDFTHGGAGI